MWIASAYSAQDDLVERTIKFASLSGPDAQDLESVKSWISHEAKLVRGDKARLIDSHDFVALVEKQEEGWLDRIVERAMLKFLPREVRPSADSVDSKSLTCSRAFLHHEGNS